MIPQVRQIINEKNGQLFSASERDKIMIDINFADDLLKKKKVKKPVRIKKDVKVEPAEALEK